MYSLFYHIPLVAQAIHLAHLISIIVNTPLVYTICQTAEYQHFWSDQPLYRASTC